MGNVFQRLGRVGVAVLFLAACGGDGASADDIGAVVPPYSGGGVTQPAPSATTPAADQNPATSDSQQPSGVATPSSNNEGPPAGSNTPVAPAPQTTDTGTNTAAPPAQTPPAQTPPDQMAPPAQTPPAETPPAQTPPAQTPPAQTPPAAGRTQVFLLFGQSNMWGVPNPQQQDLTINPRVEVLTITSCSKHGTNQWVPAQPPLHGCVGQPGTGGQGPGVGPGDYFAKTIADAFPNDTILLVPGAVPGVSIDTFQPGQTNYTNLLNRAKLAQQRGEIRGMIFHQGETDAGNTGTWPARVKTVVDRLRSDLNIPNAPFVAGELLPSGCCGGMNSVIDALPNTISRAAVAKADQSFQAVPASEDRYGNLHFNLAAQREFGKRYGQAMLGLLGNQ